MTAAGVIFVNLKIIRSFENVSFYIYIHDSFLDLLFFNLKKNRRFVMMRKLLARKFYRKYRKIVRKKYKLSKRLKLVSFLKKKTSFKIRKKIIFFIYKK
jgi:uncharacterized membrane protein YbhN (UPF0104 family)